MVEVKTVLMTSLHQDPSNVRKHSEANIRAIAASLEVFGQRKPLVVQGSRIVAGNGTFEAALSLGWESIAVADVPVGWGEAMVRAYAIADNQTALLAEWDDLLLADQLAASQDEGFSLDQLGFEVRQAERLSLTEAFAAVPDGDRKNATQMTFTLTLDQAEMVKMVISSILTSQDFSGSVNLNRNGNALHWLCQNWQESRSG